MGISIRFEIHILVNRSGRVNECHKTSEDRPSQKRCFLKSAADEVERLKCSLSYSTLENYKTALRVFSKYLKQDIDIASINQTLLKGFERWLRDKNLCLNTVSCYMRSLRSLLNKLDIENKSHAFGNVYTGRARTEKRAVSEEDVSRLKQVELRPHSFLSLVRDIFLFSYYALGMPFVDVAFLRRSQISDNLLTYHRHKTGQRIVIPLEYCMSEIINRYKSDSEYVFPLLHSLETQKAYHEYLRMLNRYNRALKTLAIKAGVMKRLTSYTARHTWASVAYNENVDLPVISRALGHTNPQTTLTYIRGINDDRLAQANHKIVSRV
ncbi:MAG: site-specific integrase [Prevotella sp.]|nr:site-specific integrase [Prevotella sp.]